MLADGIGSVLVQIIDHGEGITSDPDPNLTILRSQTLPDNLTPSFDIVLASASLEHLPYPLDALQKLLAAVRPGGGFYARTPDVIGLIRLGRLLGIKSDLGFPAHLHDMGQPFWENILKTLDLDDRYVITVSRPSIVEISFASAFTRTLASYLLKSAWYVIGNHWRLVGGWEVWIRRN